MFSGDVVVRVQIEGELAGAIGRQDDRIVREPRSGIGCAADRRTVADGAVGPVVVVVVDDLSSRPASPSNSKRWSQMDSRWRDTPASAATWLMGRPSKMIRSISRLRPSGVRGALACATDAYWF